jgi:hypothetical protein
MMMMMMMMMMIKNLFDKWILILVELFKTQLHSERYRV